MNINEGKNWDKSWNNYSPTPPTSGDVLDLRCTQGQFLMKAKLCSESLYVKGYYLNVSVILIFTVSMKTHRALYLGQKHVPFVCKQTKDW